MDKILQFFKDFVSLLPYYPVWAKVIILMALVFLALAIFVFLLFYSHASDKLDKAPYRQEVEARLNDIAQNLGTDSTSPFYDVRGGHSAAYVDIKFQNWALASLVEKGWDTDKRRSVENDLKNFQLSESERPNKDLVQRAIESLQKVRERLQ